MKKEKMEKYKNDGFTTLEAELLDEQLERHQVPEMIRQKVIALKKRKAMISKN